MEKNNLSLSILDTSTNLRKNESLLKLLLKDQATGKNIKWGTNSYVNHGYAFQDNQEIKINLITGWYEGFIRPRVDKDIVIQLERQRKRAEVFTPSWVIKKQVEAALEDMKELSLIDFIQTKWLEITCGEAPYMVNRYDMETGNVIPLKDRSGFIDIKFQKLNNNIDSEEKWQKLAIEIYKASYGYEYQGDSLLLARENLILTYIDNYFYMFGAFPVEEALFKICKIISHNVFQMDGLTYEVPYSDDDIGEYGIQLNLFDILEDIDLKTPTLATIKLWELNKQIEFKDILEGKDEKMKFDVVIGNPPYSDDLVGEKTSAAPIYHHFISTGIEISDISCFITPARFLFNAGRTPKQWNRKILNDKHFKVIAYESISSKVFKNTQIKGGVAISYYDKNKEYIPIGTFTPYEELNTISRKVSNKTDKTLDVIVSSQGLYKFNEIMHKLQPETLKLLSKGNEKAIGTGVLKSLDDIVFFKDKPKDESEYIKIFGLIDLKRVYRWINKEYVNTPKSLYKWKVFVAKSNGSGQFGEALSAPLVVGPSVGHTQSFLTIGYFETETEALNCLKYIKTKFLRTLLGILKITQDNLNKTWSKIPLQDFTLESDINWDKSIVEIDQQLYKKYDLSQEEIDFIETNVKEME
ncbi:Eco57I restriction-modification methylase domain-containing protein [Aerococcus viridans]|uniref:Eco57I restriction-modification methylase domain-containing protein n=1 Tax=Aerococcus viridans TaxID=1377 RepID=UPI003B20D2C8